MAIKISHCRFSACKHNRSGSPLKKEKKSWKLSSDCQILLSNQKLCIQSEQSAGLALVQDSRPLIMTLVSQPKQAFRFSAALEAGNPQEVWWTGCQTAGTTYWYVTSEPLHRGHVKYGNTPRCEGWLKMNINRKKKKTVSISKTKTVITCHSRSCEALFFLFRKNKRFFPILAPSKAWPRLRSHIKACGGNKNKPKSAAHLSGRVGDSSDRRWSRRLTSLYIIQLIKTTGGQQELNGSSVKQALMSSNTRKTQRSEKHCSHLMDGKLVLVSSCCGHLCQSDEWNFFKV